MKDSAIIPKIEEIPNLYTQKGSKVFHVTWVTYNSRVSERMVQYNNVIINRRLNKGLQPLVSSWYLNEEMEITVTEILKDIINENNYIVLAYNICGDHIHIILDCEELELSQIVKKLKGKSSQKVKEFLEIEKDTEFHLWAQKYNKKYIDNEVQLKNTIEYVNNNRFKHNLPFNKGLQPLIDKMTTPNPKALTQQLTKSK
jgi:REP element-mobilizing transposase RayT